jgi:hypothetical protein
MVSLELYASQPPSGRPTPRVSSNALSRGRKVTRTSITAESIDGARVGLNGGLNDEEGRHADQTLERTVSYKMAYSRPNVAYPKEKRARLANTHGQDLKERRSGRTWEVFTRERVRPH